MKDHFNWKLHSFCHSQKCHSTSIYAAESHHNKKQKWWSGNMCHQCLLKADSYSRECFGETVRIDCSGVYGCVRPLLETPVI